MKKESRRRAKKAAKRPRKPIMRHSREGAKARKTKRSSKARRATKAAVPKKAARRAKPARSRVKAKAAPARSKAPAKSKAAPGPKPAASRVTAKAAPKREPSRQGRLRRSEEELNAEQSPNARGMGAESAGQSGDTEGLSRAEEADSESVEELVEEGQAFEAGVISGVENARAADKRGVRTRQVPVDDVPQEYLDED